MSVLLEPGSFVQFFYPRHNFRCVQNPQLEPRRVLVTKVVDFRDEAPDGSYPEEPELRRGKLLVVGWDLDKCAVRRFYVESMVDLRGLDRTERLKVKTTVLKDGVLQEPAEHDDQRQAFAEAFTAQGERYGLQAVA